LDNTYKPNTALTRAAGTKRAKQQVEIRELREQVAEDATLMNQGFLGSSNRAVLQIHSNQSKIHAEIKALRSETSEFVQQTSQWLKMFADFNKNMEQIGDVETWAKNVESDLHTITSALKFVVDTENQ